MGPFAAPIIAALVGVASIAEQRKARKAGVAANRAQERAAAIQNARARRRSQAEARRIQATSVAQGVDQGVLGSSTLSGITSSIQTQLASNFSFQQQLQSLDQQRFRSLERSLAAQSRAESFTAASNLISSKAGQNAFSFIGIK